MSVVAIRGAPKLMLPPENRPLPNGKEERASEPRCRVTERENAYYG